MYIILLRFTENRAALARHLDAHKAWLAAGFDEGAFLAAGSIGPNVGGCVLARGASREQVLERVNRDPFVKEAIVSAEVLEYEPTRTSAPFRLLQDATADPSK